MIIASSSHSLLLTEHATNELVEAPLKVNIENVVVKTLNLDVSRCDLVELY